MIRRIVRILPLILIVLYSTSFAKETQKEPYPYDTVLEEESFKKSKKTIPDCKVKLSLEIIFRNCNPTFERRRWFIEIYSPIDQIVDKLGLKNIDLRETGDIHQALALIAATHTGRQYLERFFKFYSTGQIKIQEFSYEELGGDFFRGTDSQGRTEYLENGKILIKYHPGMELGVKAIVLFHEIVHALDETFQEKVIKVKKKIIEENPFVQNLLKVKNITLEQLTREYFKTAEEYNELEEKFDAGLQNIKSDKFNAEKKAYSETEQYYKEFVATFACFDKYYKALLGKNLVQKIHLEENEIRELYKLEK